MGYCTLKHSAYVHYYKMNTLNYQLFFITFHCTSDKPVKSETEINPKRYVNYKKSRRSERSGKLFQQIFLLMRKIDQAQNMGDHNRDNQIINQSPYGSRI